MERTLSRYSEFAYPLLRIVAGFLFACHGAQKLFGVLGREAMTSNPLMLIAGIIEFFGGLMIAVGLLASVAAFLASGTMAVAYFMGHAKDGFWPIQNKGELAALYSFLFLYMATRGSGRLSIDDLLKRRRHVD